jgi:PKD repeat protein
LLAACVSGCGGCRPGSVPEEEEGVQQRPAAGGAPTVARAPQAPLPTARELPTVNVERGTGAGAPPEEPVAQEPEGEEPEEADCSVIADADPDWGEPPLTVQFSVDYECTEGSATVSWDFGDGSGPSGEDNPTHIYPQAGEYVAVVTITTPDGATATDEIDITVESEEEPAPDVEPENP